MACIYFAVNMYNNKVYVGQTVNFRKRVKMHETRVNCNYFDLAYKKDKSNFMWFSIDYDISKLDDMEKYWIKILDSKYPNGYNLTEGDRGIRGYNHTKETKLKISKSFKGILKTEEHNRKNRDANINQKRTEITKRNISISLNNPELKERMRINFIKLRNRPEIKEKYRIMNLGSNNPMYGVKQSKEVIQKRVEKIKAKKQIRLFYQNMMI